MSAGQPSPRPRVFKRGGKRERRARVSDHLSERDARRIIAAIKAASLAGMPLNRFVTIHWEKQGVPHGKGDKATSALLDKMRRAMAKRGLPFAYVWSRENSGHGGNGDHAHILLHIRPYQGWTQAARRWMVAISGQPYRKGAILTKTVGRSLNASQTTPEAFQANLMTVAAYVTKGASQATLDALGSPFESKGGAVIGQRYRISRNLERHVPDCPVSR